MELAGGECKKEGERCMKEEKYFEAMLHFTKGVKYDPYNPNIYYGRSEAFLKIQQFYYALDDANAVIRMLPKWPKGYLRKAEIECLAECYSDAVVTLKKGLEENPNEPKLQTELQKAMELRRKQWKAEDRIPWFGISLGLVVGMILIVLDEMISKKPLFPDDYVRTLGIIALITVCYVLARIYRYFIQSQRASLIAAPVDLFGGESLGSDTKELLGPSSENSRK